MSLFLNLETFIYFFSFKLLWLILYKCILYINTVVSVLNDSQRIILFCSTLYTIFILFGGIIINFKEGALWK